VSLGSHVTDKWSCSPVADPSNAGASPKYDLSTMVERWAVGQAVQLTREQKRHYSRIDSRLSGRVVSEQVDVESTNSSSRVECVALSETGSPSKLQVDLASWIWKSTMTGDIGAKRSDDCLTGARLTVAGRNQGFDRVGKSELTPRAVDWIEASFAGVGSERARYQADPAILPTTPRAVGATWKMETPQVKRVLEALIGTDDPFELDFARAKAQVKLARVEGRGKEAIAHLRFTCDIPVTELGLRGTTNALDKSSKLMLTGRFSGPLHGGVGPSAGEMSFNVDASFEQWGMNNVFRIGFSDKWTSTPVDKPAKNPDEALK